MRGLFQRSIYRWSFAKFLEDARINQNHILETELNCPRLSEVRHRQIDKNFWGFPKSILKNLWHSKYE